MSADCFAFTLIFPDWIAGKGIKFMSEKRYPEIDLLKGLACALMLLGHSMRSTLVDGSQLVMFNKILWLIFDFAAPLFFLASGQNVAIFYERNINKNGFFATRFYLSSCAILFVLGFSYNLSVGSARLGLMDIFQCIAMNTAIVFLLLRAGAGPIWMTILAVASYAGYLIFRIPIAEPSKIILKSIPFWQKASMVNFAILPWISFFLLGAVLYKVRSRKGELLFGVGFLAMFIGSFFDLKEAFLPNYFHLIFRGAPGYILMTCGGSGLAFLILRHFYQGAGKSWACKQLEFLGRESFAFLILHWFIIIALTIVMPKLGMHFKGMSVLVVTMLLLPLMTKLRDRWSVTPYYGAKIAIVMAVSLIVVVFSLTMRAGVIVELFSFGLSFGFAFVFPFLRGQLRKKFTETVPVMVPAEST